MKRFITPFLLLLVLLSTSTCKKVLYPDISKEIIDDWTLEREIANGSDMNTYKISFRRAFDFSIKENGTFWLHPVEKNFSRLNSEPMMKGNWNLLQKDKILQIILTDSIAVIPPSTVGTLFPLAKPYVMYWQILEFKKDKGPLKQNRTLVFKVRDLDDKNVYEYTFHKYRPDY